MLCSPQCLDLPPASWAAPGAEPSFLGRAPRRRSSQAAPMLRGLVVVGNFQVRPPAGLLQLPLEGTARWVGDEGVEEGLICACLRAQVNTPSLCTKVGTRAFTSACLSACLHCALSYHGPRPQDLAVAYLADCAGNHRLCHSDPQYPSRMGGHKPPVAQTPTTQDAWGSVGTDTPAQSGLLPLLLGGETWSSAPACTPGRCHQAPIPPSGRFLSLPGGSSSSIYFLSCSMGQPLCEWVFVADISSSTHLQLRVWGGLPRTHCGRCCSHPRPGFKVLRSSTSTHLNCSPESVAMI